MMTPSERFGDCIKIQISETSSIVISFIERENFRTNEDDVSNKYVSPRLFGLNWVIKIKFSNIRYSQSFSRVVVDLFSMNNIGYGTKEGQTNETPKLLPIAGSAL